MFRLLVKNEFSKCGNHKILLPLLFVMAIPALVVFAFIYNMSYAEFEQRISTTNNDLNPYHYIYKRVQQLFNFFLIPYYSIFLIWFFGIERKGNGWKLLKSYPVRFIEIVYGKLVTGILFTVASALLCVLSVFIVTIALRFLKPDWPFENYLMPGLTTFLFVIGWAYLLSLPAFIILFIVILIFDSPGLTIVISIFVSLISISISPFQYHKVGTNYFWQMKSGLDIDLTIYVWWGTYSLALLFGMFVSRKQLFLNVK